MVIKQMKYRGLVEGCVVGSGEVAAGVCINMGLLKKAGAGKWRAVGLHGRSSKGQHSSANVKNWHLK